MVVQFDQLRVVMPSGLEVTFPESADLPPLDIRQAFLGSSAPFTVSLGVPLWYGNRANALEMNGQAGRASDGAAAAAEPAAGAGAGAAGPGPGGASPFPPGEGA